MKKLLLFLFLLLLLFSLLGCKGTSKNQNITNSNTKLKNTLNHDSKKDAMELAKKQLGGHIIQAIPFEYKGNKYIAVRRSKDIWYNSMILASQGQSYQKIWQDPRDIVAEDEDTISKYFTVEDFDGDKAPELFYLQDNIGTVGTHTDIFIYSLIKKELYSLSLDEIYYHLKGTGQSIEPLERLKLPENKKLLNGILTYLKKEKFIAEPVDPKKVDKDPEYAEQHWFRDNGELKSGRKKINIYWYKGQPIMSPLVKTRNSIC